MSLDYFPFLSLPPELRNRIYRFLLTVPNHHPARQSWRDPAPLGLTPSILRLSRQVYSECAAILYTENLFHANPTLLCSLPFLSVPSRPVMYEARAKLIRRFYLEVRLDCDPFWTSSDLQAAFSGAAELQVVARQASYGTCSTDLLLAFASIRRVVKAKVCGSCVSPELAHWLENIMQSQSDSETSPLEMPRWDAWDHGNR